MNFFKWLFGGHDPVSSLQRGTVYGTDARKVYEACCAGLGWDKWKSDQFVHGKPFYAKKADSAGRSVWFIVYPSYRKPITPDARFNWIKDDGEIIVDWHKYWRNYHNDGADKIVFVTMGNGWEFSGVYSHFNGDVGVYLPFDGGRYKRISDRYPQCTFSQKGRVVDMEQTVGNKKNTIPPSATKIEDHAFFGRNELTSIEIPSSVTSIGIMAFSHCSGLTSIEIPPSVTSIGMMAFSHCSGLTSIAVDISNTIYRSEGNCLIRKSKNTLILGCQNSVIPSSVTSIGAGAFQGYSGLTSIVIPLSVMSIGLMAFSGCSGLTSIKIPPSVTSIRDSAFSDCSRLTSIEIPPSVTSIGAGAFSDCSELMSIMVDVRNTAYRSERNCVIRKSDNTLILGCQNSVIPSSVTSIGDSAFQRCSGLTSIEIPSSVTSIKMMAFSGCSGLTTVYYGGADDMAWNAISIDSSGNDPLTDATRYYYSQTYQAGNYWHYVDGTPTKW